MRTWKCIYHIIFLGVKVCLLFWVRCTTVTLVWRLPRWPEPKSFIMCCWRGTICPTLNHTPLRWAPSNTDTLMWPLSLIQGYPLREIIWVSSELPLYSFSQQTVICAGMFSASGTQTSSSWSSRRAWNTMQLLTLGQPQQERYYSTWHYIMAVVWGLGMRLIAGYEDWEWG